MTRLRGLLIAIACAALLGWLAANATSNPTPAQVCTSSAVYQSGVATQTPVTCQELP